MNDISRLPKWVQQHIEKLQRERDLAVKQLRDWHDAQTPSSVWLDELVCIGEQRGPSTMRRYVQSDRMTFKIGEEEVYVGIDFRNRNVLHVNCGRNTMSFKPVAANAIEIVETPL